MPPAHGGNPYVVDEVKVRRRVVSLQARVPGGVHGCRYDPGLRGVHALWFGEVRDDASERCQLGLLQHSDQPVE